MLRRIDLRAPCRASTERLQKAFPTIDVQWGGGAGPVVTVADWARGGEEGFERMDALVAGAAASGSFAVEGETGDAVVESAYQALTRHQRFIQARNPHSATPLFDVVLVAHARAHASNKPLVRSDFSHAVDTWQWLLRIDRDATFELQTAALFHDIERLESEADARVEHRAYDYQAFKDRHARRGAEMAMEILLGVGIVASSLARIATILARHERRGADREVARLNDADALSFFSLGSADYVDACGLDFARSKVAYSLRRLDRSLWPLLDEIRLRGDVRALLAEEILLHEHGAAEERS